jgi:hypothetical protein
MHYQLIVPTDPHAAAILKTTLDALKHNKALRRDLQKLTKACCGPKSLVGLLGAPLPKDQRLGG